METYFSVGNSAFTSWCGINRYSFQKSNLSPLIFVSHFLLNLRFLTDNINPLSIYHTNHLGLVLVSKTFDGSNYLTWCRSVMRAIDGHNKFSLVVGYLPEPDSEDASKLHLWKPSDSIVASWILESLTKEINVSKIYSIFKSVIWTDSKNCFNPKNRLNLSIEESASYLHSRYRVY